MKPEELKIIAVGMGYKVYDSSIYGGAGIYIQDKASHEYTKLYNPLTNDAQLVEIMERLDVFTSTDEDGTKLASCPPHSGNLICEAKTIKEAVCKASLEYFKEAK